MLDHDPVRTMLERDAALAAPATPAGDHVLSSVLFVVALLSILGAGFVILSYAVSRKISKPSRRRYLQRSPSSKTSSSRSCGRTGTSSSWALPFPTSSWL